MSIMKKKKDSFPLCFGHLATGQTAPRFLIHPNEQHSSNLSSSSSSYSNTAQMFVNFLLFASLLSPLSTGAAISSHTLPANQTLRSAYELRKLRKVNHLLRKINKPSVKTIQACICFSFPSHFNVGFLKCSVFPSFFP